jgi:arylsulfatase A-like enzyme
MSAALLDGGECALVYGATANVLAFLVPLLHRPTDPALLFAALAQFLTLAVVVAVAAIIAGGESLFPARFTTPIPVGPAALIAVTAAMGYGLHQPALLAAAIAVAGLLVMAGWKRRREPGRRATGTMNWTTGAVLAIAPFLAQPRPDNRWPVEVATAAAIVAIVLAAALVIIDSRRLATFEPAGWRRGAAVAALTLLGFAPGWLAVQREPSPPLARHRGSLGSSEPNVVLITLDTVRADHLSVYGYERPTTPGLLDFWRRGAVRYTRAYSTSDMTLSSHASIFTGLLPSDHGAHRRGSAPDTRMRPQLDTLASRLRRAGFATLGIASNTAYLTDRFGFAAGFDYYDVRRPLRLTAPFPDYFIGGRFVNWLLAMAGPNAQTSYRPAGDIIDQASRVLRPFENGRSPFFLFLNLMDAHTPMVAPAQYRRAFGVRDQAFYWLRDYEKLADAVNTGQRAIADDEHANLVASYDAAIASMDAQLGRFFSELRHLGLFENSLIVVTSDHGELFGRSGAMGHDGIGIAPGLLRVPLLVKYPRGFSPSDTDRPVSGIDLYPTILDLCGVSIPRGEGRSLLAPVPFERPVFFESFESAWLAALDPRFRGDERGALIGERLIATTSRAAMPSRWTADVMPSAASRAADRNLDHAYAVLRRLEAEGAADTERPMPSRALLERLRSVGYIRQ